VIAGLAPRYGTLAPLSSATLIVTRGHPLELTSDVAAAWIDGRSIELDSHQSQMKRKYETKLETKALETKTLETKTDAPAPKSP
jgi:hypothetical protein